MTADKASALVPRLRFPEFRDTCNWSTLRGDSLFNLINNRRAEPGLPVLAISQEHGAIPRDQIDYHVSVTAKSVASYKEVCEGDFIISLRSFQGGIEHSQYHGICSPAYVILRKKGDVNDHYFRYLFKFDRFIQRLTRNIEGIRDGKMISYVQFSEQLLPVPSPPEQQKIADCLGSLDDLIAAEGRKLEALRQHKQGLMQQLFPQTGETVPKLRFPEFREAPPWYIEPLGRLFNKRQETGFSELPLLSVTDQDGVIPQEKTNRKNTANSNKAKYLRVVPGDIVYNTMRMWEGRSARVGLEGVVSPAYTVCRPNVETNSYFFAYYFKTRPLIEQFRKYSQGLVKDTLNLKYERFSLISVGFPSSNEQKKIADCLGSLDDLITAQAQKLDALRLHKRGLMQQLFPQLDGR